MPTNLTVKAISRIWLIAAGITVALAASARGDVMDEARRSMEDGDFKTVAALMHDEIDENPGHEEAYILLAEAQEGLGDKAAAADTWSTLKKITHVEERIAAARIGLLRTRGPERPTLTRAKDSAWDSDPFRVPVGRINYAELAQIPSDAYIENLPRFVRETKNFIVFAPNQETADLCAELSEEYLAFLLDRFLDGRAWARRVPVMIYTDHSDYVSKGGNPASSAGVTWSNHLGRSERVALYLLDNEKEVDEHSIIGVLPHELTHVVINEFFGAQDTPRWLHEAIARRLEQDRKHYAEAAKTGRDVVAGEYYRFRDLFAAENYPDGFFKVWRFYEQSATIILFLLEQGSESMVAFLQALKDGLGHDVAAAAALGIPVEGAVEELEKRWVEWMKDRFVNDLSERERGESVDVVPVEESFYSADELEPVGRVIDWSTLPTSSLNGYRSIGESLRDWQVDGDRLVYSADSGMPISLLGIRMNEEVPLVLSCKVRRTDRANRPGLVGFTMLDHRGDDTGLLVLAPLNDGRTHQLVCIVRDEIALYLDDTCVGRTTALRTDLLDEDIDYPLAFAADGPVEISDVKAARLAEENLELPTAAD